MGRGRSRTTNREPSEEWAALITEFFDRMTSFGDAEAIVNNGRTTSYGQ
jgi:hypothetical protein